MQRGYLVQQIGSRDGQSNDRGKVFYADHRQDAVGAVLAPNCLSGCQHRFAEPVSTLIRDCRMVKSRFRQALDTVHT